MTRAAAAEIAGRNISIDRSQVGTLHALAYRALGHPQMAVEVVDEWNVAHPEYVFTQLPKAAREPDTATVPVVESVGGATDGDELLAHLELLRNKCVPRDVWPQRVAFFSGKWEEFKHERGVEDFTDLIERALEETETAPGEPLVGFFDEAQDFTPLQLRLVRHWGSQMQRTVMAGDDDQTLYAFAGATPEAFLDPPVPEEDKRVLDQSYRVPVAVHRVADRWVRRLSRREPKEYLPRDAQGRVRTTPLSVADPEALVRAMAAEVDAGRTVGLLATCAYMLDKVKHELRDYGLPFHNPWRRARQDWNPLVPSRGVGAAERLVAYLVLDERLFGDRARAWTGRDVKRWTACVRKTGTFRRGAAERISQLPDRELSYGEVAALFESDDELEAAVEPSLEWFTQRLAAGYRAPMEYPLRVVKRSGAMALVQAPRAVIGTVHSLKGGELDVVYLAPDLSLSGYKEWCDHRGRDHTIRTMYVGMTRAREELVFCQPAGPCAVDLHEMLGR